METLKRATSYVVSDTKLGMKFLMLCGLWFAWLYSSFIVTENSFNEGILNCEFYTIKAHVLFSGLVFIGGLYLLLLTIKDIQLLVNAEKAESSKWYRVDAKLYVIVGVATLIMILLVFSPLTALLYLTVLIDGAGKAFTWLLIVIVMLSVLCSLFLLSLYFYFIICLVQKGISIRKNLRCISLIPLKVHVLPMISLVVVILLSSLLLVTHFGNPILIIVFAIVVPNGMLVTLAYMYLILKKAE